MQQAETYSLLFDTAWQQPDFPMLFCGAPACRAEAVAGFADDVAGFVGDVLRRPDNDHRRRDKHDVFTDNSLCR